MVDPSPARETAVEIFPTGLSLDNPSFSSFPLGDTYIALDSSLRTFELGSLDS